MNLLRILIVIIILGNFAHGNAFAQIAVGEWRDHFSYRQAHDIAQSDEKIYVATELALFIYDIQEKSYEKLSKVNGLSDAGISCIEYNAETKTLLIAYINSNIDILKNDRIYNFSEIKDKQISGNKNINNILAKGTDAYLACGFGVVVFDTDNLEFKDTYYIGENAGYVSVNDITFDDTNLYLATEQGIFYADYGADYLGDYSNWQRITNLPSYDQNYSLIQIYNRSVLAFADADANGIGTLYEYSDGNTSVYDDSASKLRSMAVKSDRLILGNRNFVNVYGEGDELLRHIDSYTFNDSVYAASDIKCAVSDESGKILIADSDYGLVIHTPEYAETQVLPGGPYNNNTGKLSYIENIIYSGTSSVILPNLQQNRPAYYNIFADEEWDSRLIEGSRDVLKITPFQENPNHLYAVTWGDGIYEISNDEIINHYTPDNSTLVSAIADNPSRYTRVFEAESDEFSNLWVTNEPSIYSLSEKTADGTWYTYQLNFDGKRHVRGILIRENGDLWIDLEREGIYAFNNMNTPDDVSDDRHLHFYPQSSDGTEIEKNVRAVAEDKNGTIWVGTIQGVFVYYEPNSIFETGFPAAERIPITVYGNDVTTQYLLKTDVVTDIEIDGADRKWFGTENSGVFLLSENGKEEIYSFNTFNSPLISNNIIDIEINDLTGEVFIATDLGIMAFRGEATEPSSAFSDVYVFPNPVRPEYKGLITVTGLTENVNVKITDISGGLVYETDALGGQAVWDGNRYDGSRAASGVYLVFCSNADGSETFVTKFLLIN